MGAVPLRYSVGHNLGDFKGRNYHYGERFWSMEGTRLVVLVMSSTWIRPCWTFVDVVLCPIGDLPIFPCRELSILDACQIVTSRVTVDVSDCSSSLCLDWFSSAFSALETGRKEVLRGSTAVYIRVCFVSRQEEIRRRRPSTLAEDQPGSCCRLQS